jgi:hypothetical protein
VDYWDFKNPHCQIPLIFNSCICKASSEGRRVKRKGFSFTGKGYQTLWDIIQPAVH